MRPVVGIAIIGAGPYGLSIAAHLSAKGFKARVFGVPMQTWRRFMPKGMLLKSEGFAMDLSDPDGRMSFAAFAADKGIPYQDIGWGVPVETFAAYGLAFQEKLVPQVEPVDVTSVERCEGGFELTLETGETFAARHVIMATGIRPYAAIPAQLAILPSGAVTHSAEHGTMAQFAGQRVAVLGGGASAMDAAAALHRAGAEAVVLSRGPSVRFVSPNSFRSRRDRLLAPMTSLGPGWKKYLCVKLPDVFRLLPHSFRARIIDRYLGPAPAWSVREIIERHVDLRVRTTLRDARMDGAAVVLDIEDANGTPETLRVDHVISATGYRVDVKRLAMLSQGIRDELRSESGIPTLSRHFETSIRNLFFVGTQAATSFGPMLRFVCGTDFAARRIARRVAASEAAFLASAGRMPERNRVHVWKPNGTWVRP